MGKIFIFLLIAVVGALYYVKQNNLFNLDRLSGSKPAQKAEVPVNAEGIPLHEPIFKVGDCINHSKDGWNFYQVKSYSEDHYSLKYCERLKGCNPELEKIHFSDFEKTYRLERKLEKCPQ